MALGKAGDMSSRGTVRVGCGAGTSDDRLEPALELAEKGDIDYLVFECLAERTIARENLACSRDPELGYAPSLHERMPLVPPACVARNIRIIVSGVLTARFDQQRAG